MTKYLLVLAGGALGSVARFSVGVFVTRFFSTVFPLGTLIVNATGSFLIGLLMMLFLNRSGINPNWRLFLVTGVLGGYTTFSSFEWETLTAIRGGATLIAMIYLLLSVVLGLIAAWLGAVLANRVWS